MQASRRPSRHVRRLRVATAALCGALWACGGPAGTPHTVVFERVVVAPVDLVVEIDLQLDEAAQRVHAEIVRQLQAQPGARVAEIFEPEAHALWRECLSIVTSSGELPRTLDTTLEVFARELTHHDDFDLLLVPSLAWRDARIAGHTARWDGVRRRLSLRGLPRSGSSPGANGDFQIVKGLSETTGLSLHISALTPTGRLVYSGWGGLDLVHDLRLRGRSGSDQTTLVLQPDPLDDPEHVREGVRLALGPYVRE